MKKRTLLIIGCVMLLCIAGWFVNRQLQYKKSEEATVMYIETHFENIQNVTVLDSKRIPTGSIIVRGYINHNEELDFDTMVSLHSYRVTSISFGLNFPNRIDESDQLGG